MHTTKEQHSRSGGVWRAPACCGCALALLGLTARAWGQNDLSAVNAVRMAVHAEVTADREDHSAWCYRDHDVQPGVDKVADVVETPQGDLSRTIELNGHPLTGQAAQDELQRLRVLADNSAEQARKRKDEAHDDAQAAELLNMLPTAFLWQKTADSPEALTLRFKPNPEFRPPDMQSRVLGAMAGELVIAHAGNRIQTLRGTLTAEVKIGFGFLGKLDQGGTFDVERRQVAPGHWAITETHVHIGGKALLFKSIGQQEDEVKTDWRPSTAPTLQAALAQLSH